MRSYKTFTYKNSKFRIASDKPDVVVEAIKRVRTELEKYIGTDDNFLRSFVPIKLKEGAPPIAIEMARAADLANVGPMAAVAGAIAEAAACEAILAGAEEAIVENGGDIYLASKEEAIVGLFPGGALKSARLAFKVKPSDMPVSVCSSSGTMGHSFSFGKCDLATIVAKNGALADAAATYAGNLVTEEKDIEGALGKVMAISGVRGVLLVKGERIGLAGDLPELVRSHDKGLEEKVTRFPG
jgi:uncharacterized protein